MAQIRSFSWPPSRGATEPGELKSYNTTSAFLEGFVDLTLRDSALIHRAAFVEPLGLPCRYTLPPPPSALLPLDHPRQRASIEASDVAALKAKGLGATEIAKRRGLARASFYRVACQLRQYDHTGW
jgi:hypothetical protein